MKGRGMIAVNSVLVLACLLALWQAVIWMNHLPAYMLPGPWTVAVTVGQRWQSLLNSLWITAVEAAGGLITSIVVGIGVAVIFAQWRWLRQTLYPYTILLQTVPIVAVVLPANPVK